MVEVVEVPHVAVEPDPVHVTTPVVVVPHSGTSTSNVTGGDSANYVGVGEFVLSLAGLFLFCVGFIAFIGLLFSRR